MFRFACLLLCLAVLVHCNEEDDCCSHDDRIKVLETWQTLWNPEYSHRRETVGHEVFKRFLEKAPDATALFKHLNVDDMASKEFTAHTVRVLNGLDLLINLAYDTDTLHEHLDHLGRQHAKIEGITAEHFEVFRETLEEILPQAIPCFDAEAFERCIAVDHHHIERMLGN